jgi:hypothetical protein
MPKSSKWSRTLMLSNQILYASELLHPHSCHPPWFDLPINICQRAPSTKLPNLILLPRSSIQNIKCKNIVKAPTCWEASYKIYSYSFCHIFLLA